MTTPAAPLIIDDHVFESRQQFLDLIASNTDRVLIFKFSADWCIPCKLLAPAVKDHLPKLPPQTTFYNLDADENFDVYAFLKSKKMVSGIPALLGYYPETTDYVSNVSYSGINCKELEAFFSDCAKKCESIERTQ